MKQVVVFGGAGFVGRYIVKNLVRHGGQIHVVVRHPQRGAFLKNFGKPKQIELHKGSLLEPQTFEHLLKGAPCVVNAVGILHPTRDQSFRQVHELALETLGRLASQHDIPFLSHLSALGADTSSSSVYASTKARGEASLHQHFSRAVILRPSVIFGDEDQFLQRFAKMASYSPILPLIGGGQTQFQPVYVGDVAQAVDQTLQDPSYQGKIFELGGPDVYSFREILELLLMHQQQKRLLVSIPFVVAQYLGACLQNLPVPPLTRDQVTLLQSNNTVGSNSLTFKNLEIDPMSLKDYLSRKISPAS